MTVDEVMEHVRNFGSVCAAHGDPDQNDGKYIRTAIDAAIAQAVEREREACAKVCDEYADPADCPSSAADTRSVATALAVAIRSRGKENRNG